MADKKRWRLLRLSVGTVFGGLGPGHSVKALYRLEREPGRVAFLTLPPDQARQHGKHLIEYADEADRLNGKEIKDVTVTLPRRALEMLLVELEVVGQGTVQTSDLADAIRNRTIEILKTARDARREA